MTRRRFVAQELRRAAAALPPGNPDATAQRAQLLALADVLDRAPPPTWAATLGLIVLATWPIPLLLAAWALKGC